MEENKKRMVEAVEVAKQADAIVLFVGSNASTSREGWAPSKVGDLPTLELLSRQDAGAKILNGCGSRLKLS